MQCIILLGGELGKLIKPSAKRTLPPSGVNG